MHPGWIALLILAVVALAACDDDGSTSAASDAGSDMETSDGIDRAALKCDSIAALSPCLEPTQTESYYVDQGLKYFDSYDADADPESRPTYAELVARWEWEPWLLLTGYGAEWIEGADSLVVNTTPSTVPIRDCRYFEVQPFVRCRISFQYAGGPCPIYEEFTFNDAGEITFIEAWSDRPEYLPMPDPEADPWGEGDGVNRLSTRVPGLGTDEGTIVGALSPQMQAATIDDVDLADFADRLARFPTSWFEEFASSGASSEDEIYGPGCGWE